MEGEKPLEPNETAATGEGKVAQDANGFAAAPSPDTEEVAKPQMPSFPEGGGRAWAVALGSAGVSFCTFGYVNSFGVLQTYYQAHQLADKSPSDISWIGSIQIFFLISGGLVSGPVFDRYGATILWPAFLVHVFAIMMTSLCKEYYQFMLAQGVLDGLAVGMTVSPCLAATGQYFFLKRGAAMGIVVAGSSLGGVIFPIMLTKLLPDDQLGFGWTMRVIGFMILGLMGLSVFPIKARLPPRKSAFLLPGAFKKLPYDTLVTGSFITFLGIFAPAFYLPSFAVAYGTNENLALYLVAIYNAGSLFGRIIPGLLADKFGRFNIFFIAAFASGILGFCWQAARSTAAVIVFAALYGFSSGAIVSMMSVAVSMMANDPRDIGTYIGMAFAVNAVAALVGTPISGAILSDAGYGAVADFTGATAIAGGALIAYTKIAAGRGLFSIY